MVLRLPEGTHIIDAPLSFQQIRGAGKDRTRILTNFDSSKGQAGIFLNGETMSEVPGSRRTTSLEDVPAGGMSVKVADPSKFLVGGYIGIRCPNDDALLDALGSTVWRKTGKDGSPYLRQSLNQIAGIAGDTLTLTHSAGFDFPKGSQVMPVRLIPNVEISDLTIECMVGVNGKPDPLLYENILPDYAVGGLLFKGCFKPLVENVGVVGAGSHPFEFESCLGPVCRNVSADGAWNKGKDGNGYFRVSRTRNGSFTVGDIHDIRHTAIQWSSFDNIFHDWKTNGDINIHGGFAHRNRFTRVDSKVRPGHPWGSVTRTPADASWAPPDGPGNEVFDMEGKAL